MNSQLVAPGPLAGSSSTSTTLGKRVRRSVTPNPPMKFPRSSRHTTGITTPIHTRFTTSHITFSFPRSDYLDTNHRDSNVLPLVKPHNSVRLSAAEFSAERQLSITRARRRLEFANELVAIKLLEELELLREALRSEAEEEHGTPYIAQQALALTHAARETLKAQKDATKSSMEVIKLVLKAEEEKLEEVTGKLTDAETQYGAMLHAIHTEKLDKHRTRGADIYRFQPETRHQERWPYPNTLEDESGSGESSIESLDVGSETSGHNGS